MLSECQNINLVLGDMFGQECIILIHTVANSMINSYNYFLLLFANLGVTIDGKNVDNANG